jgi:hypothetical protein
LCTRITVRAAALQPYGLSMLFGEEVLHASQEIVAEPAPGRIRPRLKGLFKRGPALTRDPPLSILLT